MALLLLLTGRALEMPQEMADSVIGHGNPRYRSIRSIGATMVKKLMSGGDILTAREAARYVRLSLPTFYRYIWDQ